VCRSQLFEGGEVRSVGLSRHRQHVHALQAQIAEHVVVSWVIYQRRVAGPQQVTDNEFKRLAGPLRQQDLAGVRGDSKPGQHQREMFAQRQVPERMSVFEQMGAILAGQHVEALADAAFVEPRVRQPRATGKKGMVVRLQQAADQPDELLVALVGVGRRRLRRGWGGRVEAGTPA
jgi:hypothetical protein